MFSCEFCETSKNIFSYRTPPVAASALQFSIFHVSSVIEGFLLISFQQKNEIKIGKYPDRVQIFTFFSSIDLFDVKGFERNFDRW